MQDLTLADGRRLTYDTYGDPGGLPVVFSHGLADSRVIRNPDEELTRTLGVRMVAADQPGVGGSTPQPGRRMIDWAADMEQLADHLGLGRFAVAGIPVEAHTRCRSPRGCPTESLTESWRRLSARSIETASPSCLPCGTSRSSPSCGGFVRC